MARRTRAEQSGMRGWMCPTSLLLPTATLWVLPGRPPRTGRHRGPGALVPSSPSVRRVHPAFATCEQEVDPLATWVLALPHFSRSDDAPVIPPAVYFRLQMKLPSSRRVPCHDGVSPAGQRDSPVPALQPGPLPASGSPRRHHRSCHITHPCACASNTALSCAHCAVGCFTSPGHLHAACFLSHLGGRGP